MGHTNDDLGFRESGTLVDLADEMLDHFLGGVEIRDDAITHRADRLDAAGGPAKHEFCILANGQDFLDPVFDVIRDHRRFGQNDALTLYIDQRVCCPEVDRHVR